MIAVDGNAAQRAPARRSDHRGAGRAVIARIRAWASANGIVLGERATDAKSNDTAQRAPAAIPAFLALLLLKGCIVTIDAMGGQRAIARTIIAREADDLLKENEERLDHEVQPLFADGEESGGADDERDHVKRVDGGHGRGEIRRYGTISDKERLAHLDPDGEWAGLRGIGMVEAERREQGTSAAKRGIS